MKTICYNKKCASNDDTCDQNCILSNIKYVDDCKVVQTEPTSDVPLECGVMCYKGEIPFKEIEYRRCGWCNAMRTTGKYMTLPTGLDVCKHCLLKWLNLKER